MPTTPEMTETETDPQAPVRILTTALHWPYWGVAPQGVVKAYVIRCLSKVGGHHPLIAWVHIANCGMMGFAPNAYWATPHDTLEDAQAHARLLAEHHADCGEMLTEVFELDIPSGVLTKVW